MPSTYKILGQNAPTSAATETTLYTVPAATQCVVSSITIANLTTATSTARVNIRPAGVSATVTHALLRDVAVPPGNTYTLSLGITLGATDLVSVQTSIASGLAFHIYGAEIT